jgi:DNA polymerase-3 subunit beta
MKLLKIERNAFLTPLSAVSGIVEKRHTLPILSNVLLDCRRNEVLLTATDLEIQISASCPAEEGNAQEAKVTVTARKLQDILRALPEEAVATVEIQGNRMQVKAASSRFSLQTLPAADFPLMADGGSRLARVNVPQRGLRELLQLVHYAMAQQDIRYYLNGLLLVVEDTQLRVVATDGHRLSYAAGPVEGVEEKREVILPRKAAQELLKLLGDTDEGIEIELFASQARFRFGKIELVTKLIDGKFPDYGRVIPVNYRNHVSLERARLAQALQRAAILSNDKVRGVRWLLTASGLKISCSNNEQEEAQEDIEVQYGGEALDIGFNVNYLLDVLANVPCETVTCSFGEATSSMLVTVPAKPDFKYVVMPMRI